MTMELLYSRPTDTLFSDHTWTPRVFFESEVLRVRQRSLIFLPKNTQILVFPLSFSLSLLVRTRSEPLLRPTLGLDYCLPHYVLPLVWSLRPLTFRHRVLDGRTNEILRSLQTEGSLWESKRRSFTPITTTVDLLSRPISYASRVVRVSSVSYLRTVYLLPESISRVSSLKRLKVETSLPFLLRGGWGRKERDTRPCPSKCSDFLSGLRHFCAPEKGNSEGTFSGAS